MRFYKLFLLSILFMGSVVNHVYATDVNASNKNQVLFEQYRVEVYKGPIQIPSGYTYKEDMWIDELGKRVDPIETNFAGKYYLGLHSCGAGCRYYSLTNVVDGKDLSGILDRFTSNPDEKKITLIKLFYNKYSQLLIVRYFKDSYATDYQECLFLFKNDKLNNINNCSK